MASQFLSMPPADEITASADSLLAEAIHAWLRKSPSFDTRDNYARDVQQFLHFANLAPHELSRVRPTDVAEWRDALLARGLTNSTVVRKLSVLRSLFSYLQSYGYTGANPAHSNFVDAPPTPRDGKTVGLAPEDCRRMLEAPDLSTAKGLRDRAMLAVLAFTACRVGELVRLRIGDYKTSSGHRILEIQGKGGKERRVPLHPEAFERLDAWIEKADLRSDPAGPAFRPLATARGQGEDGFVRQPLTRRSVQRMVKRYAAALGLDPAVTVHSFRVTALTTARERGADVIDLQDMAGHTDPKTTLAYIRNRDRLSKSPGYLLRY